MSNFRFLRNMANLIDRVKKKIQKLGPKRMSAGVRKGYIIDKWIKNLANDPKSKAAADNLRAKQSEYLKVATELDDAYNPVPELYNAVISLSDKASFQITTSSILPVK